MRTRDASSRLSAVALLPLLLIAPGHAGSESPSTISPKGVRQLIRNSGAKKAIQSLAEDAPTFHAVLRGVSQATPAWMSIAEQLWPSSEGYSRDMLVGALASALEAKPEAVLHLNVPLETICGYDPLTPISRRTTHDEFLRALKPREAALIGVTRPELRKGKDMCLGALFHLRETTRVHQ